MFTDRTNLLPERFKITGPHEQWSNAETFLLIKYPQRSIFIKQEKSISMFAGLLRILQTKLSLDGSAELRLSWLHAFKIIISCREERTHQSSRAGAAAGVNHLQQESEESYSMQFWNHIRHETRWMRSSEQTQLRVSLRDVLQPVTDQSWFDE